MQVKAEPLGTDIAWSRWARSCFEPRTSRRTSMRRFGAIAFCLTLVGLITALPSQLVAYTGEKLQKEQKLTSTSPRHRSASEGGNDHRRRIGTREGRQRSPLLLRHQERRCRIRGRSGCGNGQGARKQKGRTSPRLKTPSRGSKEACYWHKADIDFDVEHVRFWGESGHP